LPCDVMSNEEGASFYRWGRRGHLKMIHPLMEGTKPNSNDVLGMLTLAIPYRIAIAKVVRGSPPKMGPRHANRGVGAPGGASTPRGVVLAQSLFCRPLGLHGPLLQSLVLFGAYLLWVLGLFLHVIGP
jgi:hypothetical protein